MNRRISTILIATGGALLATGAVHGDVIEFGDKDEWIAAVGPFTTIDFTEYPGGTVVTDQYVNVGALFTDGNDVIHSSPTGYLNDGRGLDGNGDVDVSFDTPQHWLALDFPGILYVRLYCQGELIATTNAWGSGGVGFFFGFLSVEPFDAVRIIDPIGNAGFIDDLHFGPRPCPADLDGDAIVGVTDFLLLLAEWGNDPGGPPDLDGDGSVGIADFLILLGQWGPCPYFVDCNGNDIWDLLEIQEGTSPDCNGNAVPDDCEEDCTDNGIPDECDIADGTNQDCNPDVCDIADQTSPDCNGNSIPDECDEDCTDNGIPDECDIADGTSEDLDGNGIPDECEFPNDDCENATVITEGSTPFSTLGATTDGGFAFDCEGGQGTRFERDVWFLYTPSCTGIATISLCNAADFDTRLAVYWESPCPPINPLVCSDNAFGCGLTSEVQLLVPAGFPLLVRIGSQEGHGQGVLTVSCEANP
ncbi:MAG: hypothetical protein ACYSU7_18730 [Planctomycetota bacterium]|jgi:hypothetical protein